MNDQAINQGGKKVKTYYRLTCDVKNPLFDGRRAYGIESVKVLKKGQLFEKVVTDTIAGIVLYGLKIQTKKVYHIFRGDDLYENLESAEPTQLEEYFADFGGESTDYYLEKAIKNGFVTVDQLRQWRDEAENQERK